MEYNYFCSLLKELYLHTSQALLAFIISSLFILIIYTLHTTQKRKYFKNKELYILKTLDFYYVKNIWLEVVKLFVIITAFIFFVLSLRFFNINKNTSTWDLGNLSFSWTSLLILLGLLIFISFIFHAGCLIILDISYKIHLYLLAPMFDYPEEDHYTRASTYYFIIIDYVRDLNTGFTFFGYLSLKLYITLGEKESSMQKLQRRIYGDAKFDKLWTTRLQLRVNKYPKLRNILVYVNNILEQIGFFEKYIYKIFHILLIASAFVYDVLFYHIQYTHYAVFLVMCLSIFLRIIMACKRLDLISIDGHLSRYFYKDKIHKILIDMPKNNLNECTRIINSKTSSYELYNLFESHPDVVEPYFKNNYTAPYLIQVLNIKGNNNPYSGRMLALVMIVLYYLFCYQNLTLTNSTVLSIPLVLFIIIYEYAQNKKIKTSNYLIRYKIMYTTMMLVAIGVIIWVCLHRYTLAYIDDFIHVGSIVIPQHFTSQEKLEFLKAYLSYKLSYINLTIENKTYLMELINNLHLNNRLTAASISGIKTTIDNLLNDFMLLEYLQQNYPFAKEHSSWIHFLRNSIGILAIMKTTIYYYNFVTTWYDIVINTAHVLHKIAINWWFWIK